MGKSDFGTVDGAIAGSFDDGEEGGEVGVEDDRLDGFLGHFVSVDAAEMVGGKWAANLQGVHLVSSARILHSEEGRRDFSKPRMCRRRDGAPSVDNGWEMRMQRWSRLTSWGWLEGNW